MSTDTVHLTRLLRNWADGDTQARDELVPIVYRMLHRLAEHYLLNERQAYTLQPTALVHEATCGSWAIHSPTGTTAITFSAWPRT